MYRIRLSNPVQEKKNSKKQPGPQLVHVFSVTEASDRDPGSQTTFLHCMNKIKQQHVSSNNFTRILNYIIVITLLHKPYINQSKSKYSIINTLQFYIGNNRRFEIEEK